MSFWELAHPRDQVAIFDADKAIKYTYCELQSHVNQIKKNLTGKERKLLGVVFCTNTPGALAGYLAALQSKHAVCLLGDSLDEKLRDTILELYRPDWIWAPETAAGIKGFSPNLNDWGFTLWTSDIEAVKDSIYPELAVLLSTSGTTGSPKMVRLSCRNIQANADSIAEYLNLGPSERPITTLPMQYSYGLSVINSHLNVGASIIMTDQGIITREFWNSFKEFEATSLAGVPYTYQILHRLGFEKMELKSLRTLTQAGGPLEQKLQAHFAGIAERKNLKFFVMYGQTEATARITYVPPDKLVEKIGSIGIAIPQGKLEIENESGELFYIGPNVMLGYAESYQDLVKEDELRGRLATGDLARQDEDGFYFLTGRKKRFIKLFGLRVNLDDVERLVENRCHISCVCIGNDTKLIVGLLEANTATEVKQLIINTYHLHPTAVSIVVLKEIPRLSNGKVDYKSLDDVSI